MDGIVNLEAIHSRGSPKLQVGIRGDALLLSKDENGIVTLTDPETGQSLKLKAKILLDAGEKVIDLKEYVSNIVAADSVPLMDGTAAFGSSEKYARADHVHPSDTTKVDKTTFNQEINSLKSSVSEGKALIAEAVTDKGVQTASDASFASIAENIEQIEGASVIKLKSFYNNTKSDIEDIEHGMATSLRASRYGGGAASVGKYGLFVSGYNTPHVDAYSPDLIRTEAPNYPITADYEPSGGTIGNYALFAGGFSRTNSTTTAMIVTYTKDLVRGTAQNLPADGWYVARSYVGDRLLYAGGMKYQVNSYLTTVIAFDSDLIASTTALSSARGTFHEGGWNIKYALFCGGLSQNNSVYKTADAFDENLIRTAAPDLTTARHSVGGSNVGEYAIIAGGSTNSSYNGYSNGVDVYTLELIHSSPVSLSSKTVYPHAVSISGVVTIACPYTSLNSVELFTSDLVCKQLPAHTASTYTIASCATGNYVLVQVKDSVDYYKIGTSDVTELTIPADSRYKFDGIHSTEQTAAETTVLHYDQAISGYIKFPSLTLNGEQSNPTLVASI